MPRKKHRHGLPVELHGGSTNANRASLGQGSEFVVRLPRSTHASCGKQQL